MKKPMTLPQIKALAASMPPRDAFGPGSENPYIVFELSGDADIGEWLYDLPCPVIGIGNSLLSRYCDVVLPDTAKLARITKNIEATPIAAMVLVQHLRASEYLSLKDALTAESFAYATVQNGPEFKRWLAGYKGGSLPQSDISPLGIDISDGTLALTFNRPDTRNAIGIEMRDALCEALDLALMDDSINKVSLTGAGAAFSIGGAIEEFGEVSDPATAHWVRSLRLPAQKLAYITDWFHVCVNGAAIGAGAEIAGFAKYVAAYDTAWFLLPELKYGLIPGAGGTASLPRRIGRQRTAYMALSMEKIRAKTALEWGLIDAIID